MFAQTRNKPEDEGLEHCSTYEQQEDVELTVDQCLRIMASVDIFAEDD